MRQHLLQTAALAALAALACHAHAQRPPPTATVLAQQGAVIFDGQINAGSAARFLQLVQDPDITRLVITSRGGLVGPALDMALAVHERGLDVEVPTACLSSCANYVFPAGRHKAIGRLGAVAWHGNMAHVLHLQQTGQANWNAKQMEEARQLAAREAEFFSRIQVDGFVCWFAKIEPYNVEDSYFLSVDDMERFGIRSVSVREGPPLEESENLRRVEVDWAGLEKMRPAAR